MLVILDRDGVINFDSDVYIKSPAEWLPIPRSLEAIAAFNRANHTVVVATNQSGIARGLYTEETLASIHDKMQRELAKVNGKIDGVFYCPHHPDDHCRCRKPQPGLLEQIAEKYTIDFSDAILIGDALRDIQAAHAVGCKAALVKTGKGEKTLAVGVGLENVSVYSDLWSAAQALIGLAA